MAIQYICNNPQRKTRIRDNVADVNGIDYLEVYDSQEETDADRQRILYLHFVRPDTLGWFAGLGVDNVIIEGGNRVRDIHVSAVYPQATDGDPPDVLVVELDRYGDFSRYTLRIVAGGGDISPPSWLDPVLSNVDFSFKVACASDFDCQQQQDCPPTVSTEPEIDYLAKDYASFRQLMLDRLANIIPDWQERNPSDLGVAMVEILAYAGDQLSYYQDAVATEAYLDTARRRVSIRRHARLLDYHMHEGCNARTWVVLEADSLTNEYVIPAHTPLLTKGSRPQVTETDLTPQSTVEPIYNTELRDFALLADEYISLHQEVQVLQGHVGVNEMYVSRGATKKKRGREGVSTFSLDVQAGATVLAEDSVVFADKLRVREDARLRNVAYNTSLQNDGEILGRIYHPIAFPILDEFPELPEFEAGEGELEVEAHETLSLDAGDYGDLDIGHHASVTFTGGVYNLNSLELGNHSELIFTAPTELRVARRIRTQGNVGINRTGLEELADQKLVTIYFRGRTHSRRYPEIEFGVNNDIVATVYAPRTYIRFDEHANAMGVFYGRKIVAGNHGQFQNLEANQTGQSIQNLRFCIPNLESGMHVFETMHPVTLHADYNRIDFYTWGDDECCLPKGATRASLSNEGDRLAGLKAGDLLLFEEVVGTNGNPADRDAGHTHVVRLTKVVSTKDPLYTEALPYDENSYVRVLNIEWALEDALPFPLCLKSVALRNTETVGEAEEQLLNVGVARGNVVLADYGRTICREPLNPHAEFSPHVVPPQGERYRPYLERTEPTHLQAYHHELARTQPVAGLLQQDPRTATPAILLEASNNESWLPQRDLLNSDRFATEFVTEIEDDGRAYLRFGDGVLGKRPAPGLSVTATYRVGNGSIGNIGAETLKQIILPAQDSELEDHISVRNPLPAQGGTEPESITQVRLYAPQAFRTQMRAVTPSDYAQMAQSHPEVQKAVASQRWTGSWHTVFITIDRMGGREVDAAFEQKVRDYLEPYRMMGHELEIEAPHQVALDVAFRVCVRPEYLKSKVKEDLREVFSNQMLSNGSTGFFHPDNFTFGQTVYLSQLISVAMQVAGVTWVDPIRFQRWGESGIVTQPQEDLHMARLEIARLDNDPNAPENGKLEFIMEGGL